MRIAIVTINFNGSEKTAKLVESLKNQTDSDFDIFVVDNASEEADFMKIESLAQAEAPLIKLIRNNKNLGFSGGNNTGIRQALTSGSDWVVLLNNDTWVEKDFIVRLKAILGARRGGIVGIPLAEGSRTAYCGEIRWLQPTLLHLYDSKAVFDFRFSIFNFQFSIFSEFPNSNFQNYYVIGGAMAIHRNIFEKIGLLDEKYFLYFEDADFSIRARKAGIDILIAPDDCMIYHTVSTTTKKLGSPLLLRYHYRNALYFNLKNGPWYVKLAVWPWSWIISIKQLIKIAIKQNIEESKAILKGVIDFYKQRYGKI